MNAYLSEVYVYVCEEISKYARGATLRSCIQWAALCALCARMHKGRRTRTGDVRGGEMLIFGLRCCFTSLCGVATSQRGKNTRQQEFQTVDFEFQSCYRLQSNGALPTPRRDSSDRDCDYARLPALLSLLYRAIYLSNLR